ncbi:SpaH/EbpB family LPXTG-anchored major pilin [Streptococcus equi]|uniref:SpaH/EbpB family LPXTG-anchored major pilin n=1 Tax=Streptococcus equi TaxID=1336 RepID=UPI00265879A3|nr:SpaH/EbpB family LPXTG-anchored major pilin [Streptococcus equi]WKF66382.1 SpaH/EbpB family LPXTG-anchored major pilin [Streptococcus equi subsp. zooepidemicus]
MTLSRKLLYSAAALLLLAAPAAKPVAQITSGIVAKADEVLIDRTSKTIPEITEVIITKLQADDYHKEVKPDGKMNENGLPIDDLMSLGSNVRTLNDVTFVAFKLPTDISKEQIETLKTKKTVKDVESYLTSLSKKIERIVLPKTSGNGTTIFKIEQSKYGKYFVVEDLTAEGTPENISLAYAVPFILDVPMSTSDGTGYLTKVNIYPKNITGETPKSGKDVHQLGINHASYNIGDNISWFMKGTVPKNIESYEVYEFKDILDSKLDFLEVKNVKYGTEILKLNEDYSITEPSKSGGTLKVTLTDVGIKKVAGLYPQRRLIENDEIKDIDKNTQEKPFLQVEFITKINSKVVLGKSINNQVTIDYDNNPDGEKKLKTTSPSDEPDVQTGGKLFKKVGSDQQSQALAGAEFELQNENGEAINWTDDLINANDKSMFSGDIQVGKPIILKSNSSVFAIRGLEYSVKSPTSPTSSRMVTVESKKYKLKEIKAPVGYVIQDKPIEFEVNQTSYNAKPTEIETDMKDATPLEIKNTKRPSIPNTGSIGTAIFVAIGVAVMAFAAKGMKSRSDEG